MPPTPPSKFQPALTVTALALNNLSQLPYFRLRLTSAPSTSSTVATRAKWLEHGVGSHTAFHAAAIAQLAESLPSVFAVSIPHSSTSPSPPKPPRRPSSSSSPPPAPSLWLFAPARVLQLARDLLASDFTVVDSAVWTPKSTPVVTRAFTLALRRALTSALQSERAVRVADEIFLPYSRLALSFQLSLGNGPNPNILIQVTARHHSARPIDDSDSAAALIPTCTPINVFTAPLGIRGVLSPRPCAGDALSSSVLKRWREAGLLSHHLHDSAVVFLKLDDNLEVPFPRACVFTTDDKPTLPIDHQQQDTSPFLQPPLQRPCQTNIALWRSRKRPRSPVVTSDDETAVSSLHPKSELKLQSVQLALPTSHEGENTLVDQVPTSESLNTAFHVLQSNNPSTLVPTLHHPLLKPIPEPTFQRLPDSPVSIPAKDTDASHAATSTIKPQNPIDPTNAYQPEQQSCLDEIQQSFDLLADSSRRDQDVHPQASNGLEAFLMGSAENPHDSVAPFEPSGAMDMTDFSAFDDDVTVFFRDSMDDRLAGNDNALSPIVESAPSSVNMQPDGFARANNALNDTLSDFKDMRKTVFDAHMDVDTTAQFNKDDKSKCGIPNTNTKSKEIEQETSTIVGATLASLWRPLPTSKPEPGAIKSQLKSLYETDHLQRQSNLLKVSRPISKRRDQKHVQARRVLVSKSRSRPSSLSTGSALQQNTSCNGTTESTAQPGSFFSQQLRGLYIPSRFMKKYRSLKRKGAKFDFSSLRDECESEASSSDCEDDGENVATLSPPSIQTASKSETIPMMHPSASQLPDTKPKVSTRVDTSAKLGLCMDYDPTKIVDSVAVDCASVCMVLAAERASHNPVLFNHIDSSSSVSGGDGSRSSPGPRDLEQKSTSSLSSQSNSRVLPAMAPKSQNNALGPPPTRMSKKERDISCLFALLEMQLFGRMELELFESDDSVLIRTDSNEISSIGMNEKVSPPAMRKLMLGLPRSIEMSETFKIWIDAFRDSYKDNPVPSIEGPISVASYLGENITVTPLEPARVCVGYDKGWLETNFGVLPLWEKTGLEPYSEPKDVEYLALGPKDLEEDVKAFLRDVSVAYEECLFGRHQAMPESLTLIAPSIDRGGVSTNINGTNTYNSQKAMTDSEKSIAEQYHLTVNTVHTRLQALAKEHRQNPSRSANIVVYVISPYDKSMNEANVALVQAVAPLAGTIPSIVPSVVNHGGVMTNLSPAPWRISPSSKSVISVTVRIIPKEVVDRRLLGQVGNNDLLERPLRPQLMKAVCFAVYSSLRYKRIRPSSIDSEVGGILARGAMVDDLMSPMTPEIVGEAVSGPYGTPMSPLSATIEEAVAHNTSLPSSNFAGNVDQSSAVSSSYLHEAAIVLSGAGEHTGECSGNPTMVLHLAYAYCESASRFVFSWTDRRGELLDTASVPISKCGLSASRRKAFWGMWARGQRWRLPFVTNVHATICKLGSVGLDELEDWEWVLNKVVCTNGSVGSERKGLDISGRRILRRFPPVQSTKTGEESLDIYADVPTPATPSTGQALCPSSHTGAGRNQFSLDVKLPGILSVSVLGLRNADTHLLLEKSMKADEVDRRDFLIVSDGSLCKGLKAQANGIIGIFGDDGIKGIELNVLRHYGMQWDSGEGMGDDRPDWDAAEIKTIATTIACNFHDLRYVASPPCGPLKRWLSTHPVHVEAVRTMQSSLNRVYAFSNVSTHGSGR